LSAQGHLQYVVDIAEELRKPTDSTNVQSLKAAADIHLRLIDKYLPSLKSVENTGEGGGPLQAALTVTFVESPNS